MSSRGSKKKASENRKVKPFTQHLTRETARNMFRNKYGNGGMGAAWRRRRIETVGELQYALQLLRTSPRKKQYISF